MSEEETEAVTVQPYETNMSSSDTNKVGEKSQKLVSLAQQLRLCRSQNQCDPTEIRNRGEEINITENTPEELDSTAQPKAPGRAAVLVCIFEGNEGELRVYLTKRSSTLSSHSGEVALPGGKRDKADANDIETALREAQEEIGLNPSLVDVVAVLEPIFTKDENRRAEERQWMGDNYLLHYFSYQFGSRNYVIWALTAGILILVASVVYERSPEFVERRPTFWNGSANRDPPKL